MKRVISLFLLASLCLGLCACGTAAPEPTPTPEPTPNPAEVLYEKYADVIDALEAEDYDGAIAAVTAMKPVPPVTAVQITLDNLWDYFEIEEERDERTDAYGNTYALSISYYLSLKNGYELADEKEYPTDVAVGYEYDEVYQEYHAQCEIDFETFTCNKSPSYTYTTHHSKTLHYPDYYLCSKMANKPVDQTNTFSYISFFENLEFLNASGTLYIISK